jgi:uncharacterized protein (DUF305 family)
VTVAGVQHKEAVTMADSGLKSAQRNRLHALLSAIIKLSCIDRGINNATQEVTIHQLGTSLTLLFQLS